MNKGGNTFFAGSERTFHNSSRIETATPYLIQIFHRYMSRQTNCSF